MCLKLDTGSIKINIKENREDARSAELATAQNSFEIAQIKMRMKMAYKIRLGEIKDSLPYFSKYLY